MKGPYTSQTDNLDYFRSQLWFRTSNGQKVRTPLPYGMNEASVIRRVNDSSKAANAAVSYWSQAQWGRDTGQLSRTQYYAYGKFTGNVGATAGTLLNLVQYRQTASLVLSTLQALRKPVATLGAAMKKAAKAKKLGSTPIGSASNVWLAWRFGVMPLVSDLEAYIKILAGQIPPAKVYGHSSTTVPYVLKKGIYDWSYDETYKISVKYSADIMVSNPNLALAQQLGLINLPAVAWDAVPFSFIIDWFLPVSTYLGSLSDLAGLNVTNAYTTMLLRASGTQQYRQPSGDSFLTTKCVRMERQLGIQLKFPKFHSIGFSPSRIATAAALLFQQISHLPVPKGR